MDNINQLIAKLQKRGFSVKFSGGSKCKLYPPIKTQPFYSLHVGERAIHPLNRFARKNWNLDLEHI